MSYLRWGIYLNLQCISGNKGPEVKFVILVTLRFFCVWTYVKSASSPFAQSFSHAKAQQWSDDILP